MKDETSRIDIPIAGCRSSFEEKRRAGPNKIPTPTKPPTRASHTIGLGLAAIPDTFDAVTSYALRPRNRSHVKYLLARMAAWLDAGQPDPGQAAGRIGQVIYGAIQAAQPPGQAS